MTDRTLNISAREFKRLVAPVLPMAGNDLGIPVLTAVHVEARGDWLVASATDRFVFGMHRIPLPEDCSDDWSALIPRQTIAEIIKAFAPRRGKDADLVLTADDSHLSVTSTGELVAGYDDARLRWPLQTGQFPKVAKLVSDALTKPSVEDTKVRAAFLAKFATADDGGGLHVRATSQCGPVLVTNGGDFFGMVMPRKSEGFPPLAADWAAILDGTATRTAKSEPLAVTA